MTGVVQFVEIGRSALRVNLRGIAVPRASWLMTLTAGRRRRLATKRGLLERHLCHARRRPHRRGRQQALNRKFLVLHQRYRRTIKRYLPATTTLAGTTTRFRIRFVDGIFRITASTPAGTTMLDIRTATAIGPVHWYHVLFSFDLATVAQRHIYVDDVLDLNAVTFTNNTIDYTLADWSFGALPDGPIVPMIRSYSQFLVSVRHLCGFVGCGKPAANLFTANGHPV